MRTPAMNEDEYSYPLHMTGSLHFIESGPDQDEADRRIQELHQAIEDVTGTRPPAPPAKPRIGFLP